MILDKSTSGMREFWLACRDALPLMVGGVPFGLTCGLMSVAVGLTISEVLLMSALVFSGTSQFVVVTMMMSGVFSFGSLWVNVLLVNFHNLILMTSLAPYLIPLPRFLRFLLCFGISDATYALTMNRAEKHGYHSNYQLGLSVVQYAFWIASNVIGALISTYLSNPLSWGLDFTVIAVFIAILIPKLCDRTAWAVAVVAAIVSVLGAMYLEGKWYIAIACVIGASVGAWLEGREVNVE